MTGPATKAGAEELARMVGKLGETIPEGCALLIFLMADMETHFETTVAATCSPDQFAPVLRRWLERYDAGDHMAVMGTRGPDA
jgi:hypothetical protein